MPSKNKIPCTVAILTLNNQDTIKRCLESVKNFSQIIICDGNSTDDTLKIAKDYGCTIIPQYNSNKPNIKIKNISKVRNKTIQSAKYNWYFWLDSDDYASKALVSHISKITQEKNPPHLIYQANCLIKIGRETIRHSSTYPDHRIMLIHRSTKAKFTKAVHEKISYNNKKYTLGLLRGNMYLCWTQDRLKHYWNYAKDWLSKDMLVAKNLSYKQLIKYINFHLKVAIYYLLKPLTIYLKHGFKDSMPYSVELNRSGYQLKLATHGLKLLLR